MEKGASVDERIDYTIITMILTRHAEILSDMESLKKGVRHGESGDHDWEQGPERLQSVPTFMPPLARLGLPEVGVGSTSS